MLAYQKILKLKKLLKQNLFINYTSINSRIYNQDYFLYGIFYLVTSLIPMVVPIDSPIVFNSNLSITVRFISNVLCVFLLLSEFLPQQLDRYFTIYWYMTLIYTLPFSTTFVLLDKSCSKFSLINYSFSIFVLALLVDWLSFILMSISGTILGILIHIIFSNSVLINTFWSNGLPYVLYMIIFSSAIGLIFARKNNSTQSLRLKNLKLLASGIAHELRTPLASLLGNVKLLKKKLPEEIKISEAEIIRGIEFNLEQCYHIMNSILMNLKGNFVVELKTQNINQLINQIISEYPLENKEKSLINIRIIKSLQFEVDPLLFRQVIFNLITNSLFFIKKNGNGWIEISAIKQQGCIQLIFKQTGLGITKDKVQNIFEPFKSGIPTGNGIGLAFSKYVIEKMGGNIKCYSVYKKYIKFIIEFKNPIN